MAGDKDDRSRAHGGRPWGDLHPTLSASWHYVLAACALVAFWVVLEHLDSAGLARFDSAVYTELVFRVRRPALTAVMEQLSNLATPAVLLTVLLAIAAFAPGRRPGLAAAINLAGALGLNVVLKQVVQRPRPDGFRLVPASGYSFPSGHSMVAMAFFGLCIWMVWHHERDRRLRWAWCVLFALIIAGVGASRVYLGVHYASDVLAGFCVSLAWLSVYTGLVCPLLLREPASEGDPDQVRRRRTDRHGGREAEGRRDGGR